MSRQATGEVNRLDITVQGGDDTALAWALRNFERTEFVDGLGIEVDSGVVIAPKTSEEPVLGDDYVGQDFALTRHWELAWLNWTDFVAWLTLRETRYPPEPDHQVVLWARKDVYGIERVTTQ
jgi:hypothetical protein